MKKHKLLSYYIDYPEKGIITDEDVYNVLMKHSTDADRKNPKKMVEMTLTAQNILMGIFEDDGFSTDGDWMFYGNNSFFGPIEES